jgi:hypothetical protein
MLKYVMPWMRRSVVILLSRRSVFESRLIYVWVLVDMFIVGEGVSPSNLFFALTIHCTHHCSLIHVTIFFSGSAAQRRLWPPRSRGFVVTHNDVPHSVGLLWTSEQLVAETST